MSIDFIHCLYVILSADDCWMEKRGPDGRIIPFKDKFPNGLKPLADYIHSKGLKFGVYSGECVGGGSSAG